MEKEEKYATKNLYIGDYMKCGCGSFCYKGLYLQIGNYMLDLDSRKTIPYDPFAPATTYGKIGPRISGIKPLIFFMEDYEIKPFLTREEARAIVRQEREEDPKYYIENIYLANYMSRGGGSFKYQGIYYQIGDYFYDLERKQFVKHDPFAPTTTYGKIGPRVCGVKPFAGAFPFCETIDVLHENQILERYKREKREASVLVKK